MQFKDYIQQQKDQQKAALIDKYRTQLEGYGIKDLVVNLHILESIHLIKTPADFYSFLRNNSHYIGKLDTFTRDPGYRFACEIIYESCPFDTYWSDPINWDVTGTYACLDNANNLYVYAGLPKDKEESKSLEPIHPREAFFECVCTAITEKLGVLDAPLEKEIYAFLQGGVMTDGVKESLSLYFGISPKYWQGLWDDYLKYSEGN